MARENIKLPINFDAADNRRRAAMACYAARGECVFEITPVRPSRSSRQNSYYFGVVVSMFRDYAKQQGDEQADLDFCHGILKDLFLKVQAVIPGTGEIVTRTRSTTELKTVEFSEYVENCRLWLTQMGVDCPDPDPCYGLPSATSKGVAAAST